MNRPSRKDILHYLLYGDYLWQNETWHEAILLLETLYAREPQFRQEIMEHLLAGPGPSANVGATDEQREYQIFTVLAYLEKKGLHLTDEGRARLESMRGEHSWKLRDYPDIFSPTLDYVPEGFTVQQVRGMSLFELVEQIKTFEGSWRTERRDLYETIGAACQLDPEWAIKLFERLSEVIRELPTESMSPIIWRAFPSTKGQEGQNWQTEQIERFSTHLKQMVQIRPEAEVWTSVPDMLKNWMAAANLGVNFWGELGRKCLELFRDFDYERERSGEPVEWIQAAINHPYGQLLEAYLNEAHRVVSREGSKTAPHEVPSQIIEALQFTTLNPGRGSRYGMCILGYWTGWLEAVLPSWTLENLIPVFFWKSSEEEVTHITWSGYLWNMRLSQHLCESFEDTYVETAKRTASFARAEREGLSAHIAGAAWYGEISIEELKKGMEHIENEGRAKVLEKWQNHLAQAESTVALDFWTTYIFPYWEWCETRFLVLPQGNSERFAFWRLALYSHELFPEVSRRTIKLPPESIEHVGLFAKNLKASGLAEKYPEEFTAFLLAFAKADRHPGWHEDDWEELWDLVRGSKATDLEKLKNELAKKKAVSGL